MSDRPAAFTINYGMEWYPEDSEAHIVVERLVTVNWRAVLGIRSEVNGVPTENTAYLEISVSKGGRRLTVYPVRGDVRLASDV